MNEPLRRGSLKGRVLRAGSWAVLGHFLSQVIRLASTLIMTRLLVPELFGVMALAVAFITGLTMFSDLGLQQVVVQHRDDSDEDFLNSVWTLQVLRGFVIFTASLLLAGAITFSAAYALLPMDSAYAHPDLPRALCVIAFAAMSSGFDSTNVLSANRSLALGRTVRLELAAQVAGLTVMVSWALVSPTVFAIASGAVAAAFSKTVMSHLIIPGIRNRLLFSRAHLRSIFGFSRWIFLTSILGFLISTGDKLLLGGLLGAHAFGLYAVGALLVGALVDLINRIVSSVLYPALSEVFRNRPEDLLPTYYRLRTPIDALSCVAAGLLAVLGPAIVRLLYDDRYLETGIVVQILAVPLLLTGISAAGNLYMIIGKPWLVTLLIAVRLVALYASAPWLVHRFGVAGGALAVCAGYVATVPFMYAISTWQKFIAIRRELVVVPFFGGGVLLGLAINALLRAFQH